MSVGFGTTHDSFKVMNIFSLLPPPHSSYNLCMLEVSSVASSLSTHAEEQSTSSVPSHIQSSRKPSCLWSLVD